MKHAEAFARIACACLVLAVAGGARAQADKPIKIGIPTSLQLQVGRDTIDAVTMAADEINGRGGLLGRKLTIVTADETENPEQGIAAIKKLTADEKVDVMIGGYTSGVTLAQLPHLATARTIYMGVGAASPSITAKVKQDYDHYKYIFRVTPLNSIHLAESVVEYITGFLKGQLGYKRIAIIGESAKWVQDLLPVLRKGAVDGGVEVKLYEVFDTGTTDFSPLFSKVRSSGAQYLVVILSHSSSDVFAKQWYDARVPVPYGGIDVKSQDGDFFARVGGKALSEVTALQAFRSPITPKTIPMMDGFKKRFGRDPTVYTGFGGYDATYLWAEAVKRAGSLETDKVVKELEKTDYVGTIGRIVFDPVHDVKTGPGYVNEVYVQWQEGGKRVIVWPKEMADGPFVLPPWLSQQGSNK
jgi:branched-chain amino acid transport system substrate-binding protein